MTTVLCGLLLSLILAGWKPTFAASSEDGLEKDNVILSEKVPPYPSVPSMSDISLTTPPDIPLAREQELPTRDTLFGSAAREYGTPAREYDTPAREYGSPSREYESPARGYGPPAREYGSPSREYESPSREYGTPAREYGSPARQYGTPAREYGTPAREYGPPSREYVTPAREYGPPARELGPYPPSSFPYNPPSSIYTSTPVEHSLPPSTAFGEPLPFPPIEPNSLPSNPWVAYWNRLYILFEPIAVKVVGVSIFVLMRHYVIPYLVYFARSLVEEEEDERSLSPATVRVLRAVTRGVCLERVSCRMGLEARNHTITNAVISAIEEHEGALPRLVVIFRDAVTGHVDSCEPYVCKRKQSTADSKSVHWRRKEITNEIRKRK